MNSLKNINKLIIFDLDGVLVDSSKNMRKSWNDLKKSLKIDQNFSEYYKYIGLPFEGILNKIGITDPILIKKIKNQYEKNSINNLNKIRFYPDVISTLDYLNKLNYKLSIVTSKNIKRTNMILKDHLHYFDSINTPDLKIKSKPHPDQIFFAIKKAKSSIENTMFIGDSIFDKMAAKAAGVKFIYASYGYGNLTNKSYLRKFNELRTIV